MQVDSGSDTAPRLVLKEIENNAPHPTEWNTIASQWSDYTVVEETRDPLSGEYTDIVDLTNGWDTTSVHDGRHDVVIEADLQRCYGTAHETINKTFTVQNLSVRTDPPDHITCEGENPPDPITVNIVDNDTSDPMTVELYLYSCADGEDGVWFHRPLLRKENVPGPSVEFDWDGLDADELPAAPGLCTYDVHVTQTDSNPDPAGGLLQVGDSTSYRSDYLELGRALDENENPIYEAKYDGYDDNETPENEEDDKYLYIIRWYTLLDMAYPARNAHSGTLDLYNPLMEKKATRDVATLPCVEHDEQTDGLRVSVPVGVFEYAGDYRFVLHLEDDHAADYRDHGRRPPLDLKQKIPPHGIWLWIDGQNPTDPGGFSLVGSIDWDSSSASVCSALQQVFPTSVIVQTWVGQYSWGYTAGALKQKYLDFWWRDVSYKLPSGAQQLAQRRDAKNRKVFPATNVVFTVSGGHGSVLGNERVGITRSHAGLPFGQSTVGRPAIVAINADAIGACRFLDTPGDPTAEETKWLYTYVVIHELTHVLRTSALHCTAISPTCVYNYEINNNWTHCCAHRGP